MNSTTKTKIIPALITAGYIVYILLIALCFYVFNISEVKKFLVNSHFYFLEINLIFIIIGFILLLPYLKKIISFIPRKIIFLLIGISFAGIFLTSFVAPRTHRIYYDEDIYENVGQNLALLQKAQLCNNGGTIYGVYNCYEGFYNKQPYAYPYLLSIVYRIFGVSETAAFILNNLLFGFSIFIVFLIAYLMFSNYLIGIFSALIYTLIPQNLLWFSTAAAEPSTALFSALFILSLIIFLKENSKGSLFFTTVLASFAVQFRPESLLIIVIALLGILMFKRGEFKEKRFYSYGLLFLALSFGFILHLFTTSGEGWGTTGAKISFDYFVHNFSVNFLFYFDNLKFPLLFTILFIISLFSKTYIKEKFLLLIWFLCFWGIFLFFYAGSYGYGADVRYSLISYIPLTVLAGFGIHRLQTLFRFNEKNNIYINSIIAVIIIISFFKFLPQVRAETQEAWGARADHLYAEKFAEILPEKSIVLTHNPNMFHIWGKNAAQISLLTDEKSYVEQILFNQYKDGVYLHWNYWCNADDSLQNSFCENGLSNYDSELISEYFEQDFRYALYRLSIKEHRQIPLIKAKNPKLESPIFKKIEQK